MFTPRPISKYATAFDLATDFFASTFIVSEYGKQFGLELPALTFSLCVFYYWLNMRIIPEKCEHLHDFITFQVNGIPLKCCVHLCKIKYFLDQ